MEITHRLFFPPLPGSVRDRRRGAVVRLPDELRNRNEERRGAAQDRPQQLRPETREDRHVSDQMLFCSLPFPPPFFPALAHLLRLFAHI